jgi:DnaJ-class molecular chaperone
VENLDGEHYAVNVRPGCQHGEMSLIAGKGFKNLRGNTGNLIVIIIFNTPAIKDPILKEKLEKINAEINSIK